MLTTDRIKTNDLVKLKCYQDALFLEGLEDQTELIVMNHKTSRTMRMPFKTIN